MLLLLLLTQVAAVGVIFDNFLVQVIHPVHQKLKALLQVVAGMKKKTEYHSKCFRHHFKRNLLQSYVFHVGSVCSSIDHCLFDGKNVFQNDHVKIHQAQIKKHKNTHGLIKESEQFHHCECLR